jgi:hypothetical protein
MILFSDPEFSPFAEFGQRGPVPNTAAEGAM